MTSPILIAPKPQLNGDHITLLAGQERFTFASSGITVTVNKVSQARTIDHRNAMRRKDELDGRIPQPPKQMVDIAGELVEQTNITDPDYLKALVEYTSAFDAREFEWFLNKTLVIDVEAVSKYRAKSSAEDGTDYPLHSDWHIYMFHILALNMDDYEQFQSTAWSISRPTPAAIADAKARF